MRVALAALAALLLAVAAPAHAWGPRAHEAIAWLAAQRLGPQARAEIESLLGDRAEHALRDASTWADAQRRWPGVAGNAKALHYVNFPRGTCRYDAARDCRGGRCIVAAIARFERELRESNDPRVRADALRWLVHLVADLHQPLHAALGEDRGGNLVQVRFRGEGTNLHQLLDSGLLRTLRLRPIELADRLALPPDPTPAEASWSRGAAVAWAAESCSLVAGLYPVDARRVDSAYEQRTLALLERRMDLAASRLAVLLDAAFARESRPARTMGARIPQAAARPE